MLGAIYRGLQAALPDDPDWPAELADGFTLGRAIDAAPRPYLVLRQIPGGAIERSTGGHSLETYLFRFELAGHDFDQAETLATAIARRLDDPDLSLDGVDRVELSRDRPFCLELRDDDGWWATVEFSLTVGINPS